MFGELPAWGFYARHVEGLEMKNITLRIKAPDYRPTMLFDDVDRLQIEGLDIRGDRKNVPYILRKVTNTNLEE